KDVEEGRFPFREGDAMPRLDLSRHLRIDQLFRAARPRQQDSALLKRLTDRRDPETQCGVVAALAAGMEFGTADDVAIGGIDAATGKNQRAGGELDLMMAHHHEHLDLSATLVVGPATVVVGSASAVT